MWDGKLAFALLVAIALSAILGRIVAARYRKRVLELMTCGAPPPEAAHAVESSPGPRTDMRAPSSIAPAENARARRRLATCFVAISVLIALSLAWFNLAFVYTDSNYGIAKVLTLAMPYAWIAVPSLALLWRWPSWRSLLATIAYMSAAAILAWWRSNEQQNFLTVAAWLGFTILPAFAALTITAAGRARVTGPYLFPGLLALCGASVISLDILDWLTHSDAYGAIDGLVRVLGAFPTILLFAFLPWILFGWPLARVWRLIGSAYRAKRFSEPIYLFGAYWLIALLVEAMASSHSVGLSALLALGFWLWIPAGFAAARRWLAPAVPAPDLLVLRVFRRDAEMEALFDAVVERWRYTGPVSLIAASDLALRTLEPDELFAFLSGRLRERFIANSADLAHQLRDMDRQADPDGRFRITEFYCFDTTWKIALAALVARTDRVLMDLRSLNAANLGCLHELEVLASAACAVRVLVLFDARTDLAAARRAIGNAEDRFDWLNVAEASSATSGEVLQRLLMPTTSPAIGSRRIEDRYAV